MNKFQNLNQMLELQLLKGQNIIQWQDLVLGFIFTLLLALLILQFYKRSYHIKTYNHSFGMSVVISAMITYTIIVSISTNVVLSLGMVGALSIVRFRMAIKNPLDIMFIYWAIALGIVAGAGLYVIALVSVLFIGALCTILKKTNSSNGFYLLALTYDIGVKGSVLREINQYEYQVKSKNVSRGVTELIVEIRLLNVQDEVIEKLGEIEGVINASLVNYDDSF